ncbi:iron complex transport system substrate-binding protein [Formosa sp. Hel1_31_208]|uniref:ABC transporter substrate-binding protein n=1 Tax=Formosa sp. Hel1_31_208 TaxID=1798225 RepID=UPI00087CBD8B|nr:ABC transporter substrate-binding protein [Formosa sp. Hel1_31_208]SDS63935.1 iron complex transport system substrate-binding protein [Formosa sp. Hel1_31_208]
MLHNKTLVIAFLSFLSLFSCIEDKGLNRTLPADENQSKNKYAEGFLIETYDNYNILTITNPWPNAHKSYRYALIPKENAAKTTLNKDDYDGILITPIERIVITSTTHVPALELLNVEHTLVGFPGTNYISSEKTRERIEKGNIRELGKNEGINTEVLLELRPEVVIAFGVDGTNKSMEIVSKGRIPVIYNGDWVEKSPLAKAEWIKFFGALYQKEKEADSLFNQIEHDYLEAKTIASKAISQPTVLCGAMHKDVWYLPNGSSPEAQFLKDANVNYLWSETTESGSIALSFEAVFERAKDAQLWLSPSYYASYEALRQSNSHYTEFDAFKNRHIFTFSNTTGTSGGVIYYELGTARPDLVLKDMIKICHPDLLNNYDTTFFKPLD